MMATAPTIDSPADVPVASSEPRFAAASHDVDPDAPVVNGTANYGDIENKHITNIEDSSAPTEASVSGGSDTEASRADGSRQGKDDEKGHNRAGSSIKKPATFKAVSVNKKFLASKVTTPGATAKAGDISRPSSSTPPPGASTPSSSKPRLIAKTAPGAGSRLSSLVNGGSRHLPQTQAPFGIRTDPFRLPTQRNSQMKSSRNMESTWLVALRKTIFRARVNGQI
ncbi:hypothetical protein V2G26_010018 [Clonostachys chloroleuca]